VSFPSLPPKHLGGSFCLSPGREGRGAPCDQSKEREKSSFPLPSSSFFLLSFSLFLFLSFFSFSRLCFLSSLYLLPLFLSLALWVCLFVCLCTDLSVTWLSSFFSLCKQACDLPRRLFLLPSILPSVVFTVIIYFSVLHACTYAFIQQATRLRQQLCHSIFPQTSTHSLTH